MEEEEEEVAWSNVEVRWEEEGRGQWREEGKREVDGWRGGGGRSGGEWRFGF